MLNSLLGVLEGHMKTWSFYLISASFSTLEAAKNTPRRGRHF